MVCYWVYHMNPSRSLQVYRSCLHKPSTSGWLMVALITNLVGGLVGTSILFSHINWVGNNHPNWRSHIFQRGSAHKPPTRNDIHQPCQRPIFRRWAPCTSDMAVPSYINPDQSKPICMDPHQSTSTLQQLSCINMNLQWNLQWNLHHLLTRFPRATNDFK